MTMSVAPFGAVDEEDEEGEDGEEGGSALASADSLASASSFWEALLRSHYMQLRQEDEVRCCLSPSCLLFPLPEFLLHSWFDACPFLVWLDLHALSVLLRPPSSSWDVLSFLGENP